MRYSALLREVAVGMECLVMFTFLVETLQSVHPLYITVFDITGLYIYQNAFTLVHKNICFVTRIPLIYNWYSLFRSTPPFVFSSNSNRKNFAYVTRQLKVSDEVLH